MPRKKSYTITEAAAILKISRAAVHEAIKMKRLKAKQGWVVKRTRAWRIDPKSLKAYRVSAKRQAAGKKTWAAS
jgi:predicted DNA-binding protein (UPF0251 family)